MYTPWRSSWPGTNETFCGRGSREEWVEGSAKPHVLIQRMKRASGIARVEIIADVINNVFIIQVNN
jgi:hypothetical protein